MEKPQIAFQVMECQEEKVAMYTHFTASTRFKKHKGLPGWKWGEKKYQSNKDFVNHIALCN